MSLVPTAFSNYCILTGVQGGPIGFVLTLTQPHSRYLGRNTKYNTTDEVDPSYSYPCSDASLRASCSPPPPLPPLLQAELHINWQNWHHGSPCLADQVLCKLNFMSPVSSLLQNMFIALLCEQLQQNDPKYSKKENKQLSVFYC